MRPELAARPVLDKGVELISLIARLYDVLAVAPWCAIMELPSWQAIRRDRDWRQ